MPVTREVPIFLLTVQTCTLDDECSLLALNIPSYIYYYTFRSCSLPIMNYSYHHRRFVNS